MNAHEFAEFRLGPEGYRRRRTGRWRLEIGQHWHERLQEHLEAEAERAGDGRRVRFEVPVEASLRLGDWLLVVSGRIDQLVEQGRTACSLREVKTVADDLPCEPDDLIKRYGAYVTQLAIYCRALEGGERTVRGELVFVDYETGTVQEVEIERAVRDRLIDERLGEMEVFLKAREEARERCLHEDPGLPFRSWRPGQEMALEALEAALREGLKPIFFEAPTGFGKTGLVMVAALRALRAGWVDRLVYVTGKSTGQFPVMREMRGLFDRGETVRYVHVRNRREHEAGCRLEWCEKRGGCREEIGRRWREAGLSAPGLWEGSGFTLEDALSLGNRWDICPYEITRCVLPYAEVWLGDYNYVFSRRNQGVFFEQPGFAAERTLLIVDEAHNLPARVADGWSFELHRERLLRIWTDCQFAGFGEVVVDALEVLTRTLGEMRPTEALEGPVEMDLREDLERVVKLLLDLPWPEERLRPETEDGLWQLVEMQDAWQREGLERLVWSPGKGRVKLACLSAAPLIGEVLGQFGRVVMMSATLEPLDVLKAECGVGDGRQGDADGLVRAAADWRQDAYRVAIDVRVDTRYRQRDHFIMETARTIEEMACGGVLVVFFPSYRYAASVAEAIAARDGSFQVAMQPRGVDLQEQGAFIDEALMLAHAIFLVVGSGFAEGIDLLGGRVDQAMVVSPCLPEVNAEQRAKQAARSHLGRERAFREVYLIPAMVKINQALGRLVRGPGQKARVLLHGKRFAEPGYADLLALEYRQGTVIADDRDLAKWLET